MSQTTPSTVSRLTSRNFNELLPTIFPDVPCPIDPRGNRVLVQIATPVEKTDGGIILPGSEIDVQKWTQKLCKVLRLGKLAYRDRDTLEEWPEGPWCKVGEYIRIPQYGGDRTEIVVPPELSKYDGHVALFATISDRDVWSGVDEGFNPLTLKGWF